MDRFFSTVFFQLPTLVFEGDFDRCTVALEQSVLELLAAVSVCQKLVLFGVDVQRCVRCYVGLRYIGR